MEMDVWLAVFGGHPTVKAVGTGAFFMVVGCRLLVLGCRYYCLSHYKTNNPQPTTDNKKQKSEGQKQTHSALRFLSYLELLKEIITLIIYEDESREVLYANLPYSLHTKLWIFHAFDALDIAG